MKISRARSAYYHFLKPILPRRFQLMMRFLVISLQRKKYANVWPIERNAAIPPSNWADWPEDKQFALVLTHDVECAIGVGRCKQLMKLEADLGFRSAFYFVPERYEVDPELRHEISKNGFEVGVHGLLHDGKLYSSKRIFQERAGRINKYLTDWEAKGFRSPAMHHNLDWIHALKIEYDASTFDTDPFEPQPDGVGTIFPFWVKGNSQQRGYVELPYTLPQDFTLFVAMKEKGIGIWKKKLDWIVKNRGMVLLITHPDYMNFDGRKLGLEEYPARYYEDLLLYIKERYKDQYWNPLPREISRYVANNCRK